MKRFTQLITAVFISLILSSGVFANGLSLNSVGTKALGMGGAFVGLADDATAIYWNPAGLAGQNSGILVFVTDIIPMGTYKYDTAPYGAIDAKTKTNHYVGPNLFFNYTMGDWAFGLGAFVPAGLGAEWDGDELKGITGLSYEWMSKIGVFNISPSVAYQISDKFSIGVAANIYYAMFDMKRPNFVDLNGDGIPESGYQYEENSSGLGYGVTLGLKYDICDKFSLGATFRTSTKVTMSGEAELKNLLPKTDFDRDVTWPMWIGAGIAYKPSKVLTLAFDVQYSKWSELDKFSTEYKDSPPWQEGEFLLNWKDATQIRFGAEYYVSDPFALRIGYYYDPAPGPDETLNILFPSSTNHVATGGGTFTTGSINIDFAFEYLFGAEREIEYYPANSYYPENMAGKHQLDVFAFSIGLGYAL